MVLLFFFTVEYRLLPDLKTIYMLNIFPVLVLFSNFRILVLEDLYEK